MKKWKLLTLFLLLFTSLFSFNIKVVKADVDLDILASGAVLMEPVSKKILYELDKDKKLYPASMTKMMGLVLVLEALKEGKISLEDEVTVSSYASSMGGTQIFLEPNEKMPLVDLFKAVAINSANDAIVALGEHVFHSPTAFIDQMNKRAKELNMLNTSFKNATGFDDEEHYSTAYDMALLASHLVSFGDQILAYTSLKEAYIRNDSESPFWLVNTNKLLRYYEGMDGLKTGYTTKAGYNLASTAKRNGVRLVAVVMNLDTIAHRSQDTIRLLDYGFSLLKSETIFTSGQEVAEIKVNNVIDEKIMGIVKEDINIVMLKEERKEDLSINVELDEVFPPIEKDEMIGRLVIETPSKMKYVYPLYASKEVSKVDFLTLLLDYLWHFIF